jgi:UDP-N-acetylmuramoyl-tripeptide--D-alanyl-D-alanine ligase
MEPTKLQTIAQWAGGILRTGRDCGLVTTVCTDSRSLQPGDLFVALRGDNFDAHTFVDQAAELGAIGAIVEKTPAGLPQEFGVIEVRDTLRALQELATNYRRSLPMQVVGLTGSNGKTSTKDMTWSVLSRRFQVARTEGNLNNHIGVPLTVLRARESDQIGVFEMGMNHPGEIAPLAAIAGPDVAVITNIGMAHIEHMGTREAIAQEKGMLAESLGPGGYLVLNGDDDFSDAIAARTKADVVLAGLNRGDIRASDLHPHLNGVRFLLEADGRSVPAEVPVPGVHMVRNALLAVATGRVFGLSLEECAAGLRELRLTKGRLEQKILRGIHVLDDSYNANPDSMAAALTTLAGMPAAGRRIAVLGRMGELGHEAEPGHRRAGETAAKVGIDCVISVGNEAHWISDAAYQGGVEKVLQCESVDDAVKFLRGYARPGDLVLVKGSRSSRMERVVEGLHAA